MHGTKAANLATQESDLLLVFGARFDDRVTGKLDTFAPHAKVIHCDIDVAELGKLRRPDVALRGDLSEVFCALAMKLNLGDWHKEINKLKQDFDFRYAENQGKQPINPWWLLNTVSNQKAKNAIVVTDVGQHQMWSAQHMKHYAPENFITSAGFGTMGFGLPAAIGAQKARPNDDVILITGDGSLMMNVQELGTIKRGKTPVKIILLDNQRLGMVRQWQTLFFQARHSNTILDDNPDFVTLASAFDIKGERIESGEEVQAALDRLFASEGAYLLHICIPAEENVWPLVPPNACNVDMLEE
ncbi:Acetolactate synthase isozyme 2 large subunit [uncultured Avibacterium sp.]|uniref:Acetolactate synthase isozyme 2 large subunit n=1 Tax=uncultured Avibacterium sp. TaxID=1936169 RepID=A0A486XCZ5_9PAST|nr:Acetolactate synthase isozyme 2 large subunit [uncultured Avibacterium sp.]